MTRSMPFRTHTDTSHTTHQPKPASLHTMHQLGSEAWDEALRLEGPEVAPSNHQRHPTAQDDSARLPHYESPAHQAHRETKPRRPRCHSTPSKIHSPSKTKPGRRQDGNSRPSRRPASTPPQPRDPQRARTQPRHPHTSLPTLHAWRPVEQETQRAQVLEAHQGHQEAVNTRGRRTRTHSKTRLPKSRTTPKRPHP